MHELGPVLLVVLGICVAGLLADRTGVPSPVLLVVGALAVASLPGHTTFELDPELVLTLVLPPLLYSAALDASLLDFRANARPIALLSVGLVVFSALVVAAVAHAVVPGLPWAAAIALGAVVAPPDAVAAIAVGRRVGMPSRLQTLIEGEGLLNDATALVLYRVAVAAVGGSFSLGDTARELVLATVSGAGVGLVVAWAVVLVRRRLDHPLVENVLSLVTPFLVYEPAEKLHGSGVLGVVVCGLVLGHQTPTLLSSRSRLQTQPVWNVVTFLLEGFVFLLIGLQLPSIVDGLQGYDGGQVAWWTGAVVLAVLLSRPLWVLPATSIPRLIGRASDSWRVPAALSWAGMRGVVSLAAALALPTEEHGAPFPRRDLLLFLVFVIILTTLLVQGLTFGRLLRLLGLRPDRQGTLLAQASAQQAAVTAALSRLDQLVDERPEDGKIADELRALARARANARWERLGEVGEARRETPSATWRRLRAQMLEAERAELLRQRDAGQLSDEALREMQRSLDLEEAALTTG